MTSKSTENAITNHSLIEGVKSTFNVPVEGEYFRYYIHPGGDIAEVGFDQSGNQAYKQTVDSSAYESYIVSLFNDIDSIIDLDFARQLDHNGTIIDIYAVADDGTSIVGGTYYWDGWFDIDYEITGNYVFDQNTIVHELGHALGLDHPLGNGYEPGYTVDDTVMSYNIGSTGWNNAFTEADIEVLKRIWGNENDAKPTDIKLSKSNVDENISSGSTVAFLSTLDPDAGDTHTYSLISGSGYSGSGYADSNAFIIDGNQLKIKESPNFESKTSYSIRLQTKDSGGQTLEKDVTFYVTDINEDPTDLLVSASVFDENILGGSAVATLSTSDPDSGDTHTYALVSGNGDTDNSAFSINGEKLIINKFPDFETQSAYSIRVQTKDSGGLTYEKSFILTVDDLGQPTSPVPVPASTQEDRDNLVRSIEDITTPDEVSNFALKAPITFGDQSVADLIVGTVKKDKITGSIANEVLTGGKGKDLLNGGGGSDGFLFNDKGFGKKQADKILDFNSEEGDSILVYKHILGLDKKVKLKTVASKKTLKKASKTNNPFVYDEKKGFLYFNENGKEKGWGDGGLLAILQGKPELITSDLTFI